MSETANASRIDHEARHRALVDHLVAELRPVRRLWPVRVRLAIWIAFEAGLLLYVIRITHRTNLAQQLRDPWYLLGIVGFAMAGVVGAAFSLRSAIPGRDPRRIEVGLLMALTVAAALLLLHEPIILGTPLGYFIHKGQRCALEIALFAAVPLMMLLWAVRRGAPLTRGRAGALAGAGAFLFSFALMRVICPIDESLHLFVWHLLPALIGVVLSAGAGFLLLRRQPHDAR